LTDLFDYGSLIRQLHLSFCCLICHTRCSYRSIFSLEFIVKQFELICFARLDYVNGIGNKKFHLDCGLYQPTESGGETLQRSIDYRRKRTYATHFNDDFINGNRNVAHSISQRNSSRMEKRSCLGNHWWTSIIPNFDCVFSSYGLLFSGHSERKA